jgi:hypothetical protein
VAAVWFHTACLPLPSAVHAAVRARIVADADAADAAEDAAADGAVAAAADAAAASATAPVDGAGTGLLLTDPPAPVPVVAALPPGPSPTGSGKEEEVETREGEGATTPLAAAAALSATDAGARGPSLLANSHEACAWRVLTGDVPGGVVGSGVPLLGAAYTAAPGAPAASPPTAARRAAAGAVTYDKSQLDFAVKDRAHALLPPGVTLTLCFEAVGLSAVFYAAVGAGEV